MTIAQVIERFQDEPFEWGHSDCCQFVGECIAAVTGENLALLVEYADEAEALAMIEDAGGLDVVVSSVLGDPVAPPASDNDVVMVRDGETPIVGFVWNGVVLVRTPQGLVDWPMAKVEHVWPLRSQ